MSKSKESKAASREFWDAVISAGSNVINCDLCGRTHFVQDTASTYQPGELARLRRNHKRNPSRTIFHGDASFVSWGYINGKQAVYGCPCNKAAEYEILFWRSRHVIAKYFSARAETMKKHADKAAGLAKKVKDAIEEEH
jgi:hypothetical protein